MYRYDRRRRLSRREAFALLIVRVVFFGGVAAICLVARTPETDAMNRSVLLALALIMASLGILMVGQAAYGAVRGFRADRVRGL